MATVEVDSRRFAAVFLAKEQKRIDEVKRAVVEAALLSAEIVAQRVPVDLGQIKTSIRAERTANGAEVIADAPHSGVIECGSRPHVPPLQPLIDWVRRHMGAFGLKKTRAPGIGAARTARAQRARDRKIAAHDANEAAIEGVARAIQNKIAHEGSAPRWFMRNSLPEMQRVLQAVIERRIAK